MPSREYDVAALDEIPMGEMLGVTAGSENVLLTRDNGTAYAVGGICPMPADRWRTAFVRIVGSSVPGTRPDSACAPVHCWTHRLWMHCLASP